MSQSTCIPPTKSPLFDSDDADIILLSSDNIELRVHKLILGRASSVFHDMFTVPTTDHAKGIQTVPVTEDGSTLTKLLQLCYPMINPSFDNIKQVGDLLRVCDKYQMVDMMNRLAKLSLGAFTRSDPLQAYALACCSRADEEARKAAFHCLRMSLSDIISSGISKFPYISVASYSALLKYHTACSVAARKMIISWNGPSWGITWADFTRFCWNPDIAHKNCPRGKIIFKWEVRQSVVPSRNLSKWWTDYIEDIAETFTDVNLPVLSDHVTPAGLALPPPPDCDYCKDRYAQDLFIFLPRLQKQIGSEISKVKLEVVY
ncbi:hypothetical protein BDW22DRAFT_1360903 [Trametopsis cervina]|nr:hypothetical protein BDW22DRAFT_1360903 [Trametopsis cervina]